MPTTRTRGAPANLPADMRIETLEAEEMLRIGEIDRSESVDAVYVCVRSDDGLCLRLEKQTSDPPRENPGWDEDGVHRRARWWRRVVESGGLFIAAQRQGRIAGFAVLGPTREEGALAEMVALFVSREHRSRGLGRALMEDLERRATERGVKVLTVDANSEVRAVEFYRSLGYRLKCLINDFTVWYPETETNIILAKELNS